MFSTIVYVKITRINCNIVMYKTSIKVFKKQLKIKKKNFLLERKSNFILMMIQLNVYNKTFY